MKKILIIEDDPIVANIYCNKFRVDGFQVEIALDGQAGLELANSFVPDAILVDLIMPKLNGIEFLKEIRAQDRFKDLPIIVFSNTSLNNMIQQAWQAGATKCLSKANCTHRQVIEVIRRALPAEDKTRATPAKSDAGPAPKGTTQACETEAAADAEFQIELRKSFIESLPPTLAGLRPLLQGLIKNETEEARVKQLQGLYHRIHALTSNAGMAGVPQIAQMTSALEALLKELYEKTENINASTIRTVAMAIDFLTALLEKDALLGTQEAAPAKILVVDDDAISRRVIACALEKAGLKSVHVEDPQAAYDMLMAGHFDLIFLDVDMPGMTGFELCSKLRNLPAHKNTPVVFVAGFAGFETRAKSIASGGNDLIAKPFLFIELAVKALVYVLRPRLEAAKA